MDCENGFWNEQNSCWTSRISPVVLEVFLFRFGLRSRFTKNLLTFWESSISKAFLTPEIVYFLRSGCTSWIRLQPTVGCCQKKSLFGVFTALKILVSSGLLLWPDWPFHHRPLVSPAFSPKKFSRERKPKVDPIFFRS